MCCRKRCTAVSKAKNSKACEQRLEPCLPNVCRRRTEHLVDWAATLRKEAERSPILRSDDIARRYGIVESAVGNALRRQERRELVEHVSNKIYVNKLAHDFSPRELVGILRTNAYISGLCPSDSRVSPSKRRGPRNKPRQGIRQEPNFLARLRTLRNKRWLRTPFRTVELTAIPVRSRSHGS